ncbi:globin family protein [Microlunatus soli]|uniref:Nitric oxide dioxygenase n=1 Tax=Microlunatus soli TaxID=630515 RepID=A0A1H1YQD1_9ACTN|nr:globin family protein [Microlunatus soli]SDT23623.1 nitric oxide dioxygenase [Microlunatus soli]
MDRVQIDLVQSTFAQIAPIADIAAGLFYDDLFNRDPSLRLLFADDLTEQRQKLMQMLGAAVDGLDDWEATVPVVRALGERHAGYGVLPEHFDTVGAALIGTLEKGLGEDFTPQVKDAWERCYGLVAGEMRSVLGAAAG